MRKLDYTDVEVLESVYKNLETIYLRVDTNRAVKDALLDSLRYVGYAKGLASHLVMYETIEEFKKTSI